MTLLHLLQRSLGTNWLLSDVLHSYADICVMAKMHLKCCIMSCLQDCIITTSAQKKKSWARYPLPKYPLATQEGPKH